MGIHRSAMGKSVDMSALVSRNEKTRAVGNMKVNARGDTIDSHGRIIASVTEKVNTAYSKTVGNKSANVNRKPTQQLQPDPIAKEMDLTDEERELENSLGDDLEVEKIKQAELKEKKK
jgi:hypothetical protein